jgi:hypothetical protein
MPRFTSEPACPAWEEAHGRAQTCYYWLCAGIVLDAYDAHDAQAMERVRSALSCAQSSAGGNCVRAGDCRELALGALARLLQQRGKD